MLSNRTSGSVKSAKELNETILKFRDYLNEKPFQLKIVSAAFAGHAAETQNDVYA